MIQHKDLTVMDDVEQDLRAAVLESIPAEQRLQGLSADERLQGLSADERLQGLSVEDVVRHFGPDDLERLRKLIEGKESAG